jgi:hypothetical protein
MRDEAALWSPKLAPKVTYEIDVRVDGAVESLEGSQVVSWINDSREEVRSLRVLWDHQADRGLDPGTVGRIEAAGEDRSVLHLGAPVAPGDRVELQMTFRGPANALGWHPRLDWGGPPPFDRYEVCVETAGDPLVIATGRRQGDTDLYLADGAPCFGFVVREGFEVVQADVDGVLVQAAYSEKTKRWARHVVDTAADAIRFYTEWAGFYPATSLWIVPALDEIWGGGPLAPGIVLQYGAQRFAEVPPNQWTYLTAHEIGHQYWGEYVLTHYTPWPDTPGFRRFEAAMAEAGYGSNRGLLEWLPLGAGIYMDRLYARSRGVDVGHPRRRMQRYVDGAREGIDTTLEGKPYPKDVDYNNIIAHSKGFAAISAFAHTIGHEAFERILRRCLAEYGGQRVDSADLQRLCEEESGQDLEWLFEAWVRTNQVLSYEVTATECEEGEGGFQTIVRVQRTGTMRMPVPVEVTFEDGSTQRGKTDRLLDEAALTFRSGSPLSSVVFDPDEELALIDCATPTATE